MHIHKLTGHYHVRSTSVDIPGRSRSYERDCPFYHHRLACSPPLRRSTLIAAPMLANAVRSSNSIKTPLASHTANHSFMVLGKPMCGGETDWRRWTPTTSDRCLNKSQRVRLRDSGDSGQISGQISVLLCIFPRKNDSAASFSMALSPIEAGEYCWQKERGLGRRHYGKRSSWPSIQSVL